MKSALFAACLAGVTLLGAAQTRAQGIAVGVPVYSQPVYAAPVYAAPVYPAYTTGYYPAYAYTAAPAYYAAPAAVYAAPYAVAPSVVVGGPLVYGYWGRHHARFYYRW